MYFLKWVCEGFGLNWGESLDRVQSVHRLHPDRKRKSVLTGGDLKKLEPKGLALAKDKSQPFLRARRKITCSKNINATR